MKDIDYSYFFSFWGGWGWGVHTKKGVLHP